MVGLRKRLNLTFEFDFSKWRMPLDGKQYVLSSLADFVTLMWKGLGFLIGVFIVTAFHWILVVLLVVWLAFDIKVEIREKQQ